MSGPTPGPWEVEPYSPYDKEITILGGAIVVDYDDVNHEEQEANARLIARSPSLLSILKRIVESVPHGASHDALFNEAKAEIAKAEGPQ